MAGHRHFAEWVGLNGRAPTTEELIAYMKDRADDEIDAVDAAVLDLAAVKLEFAERRILMLRQIGFSALQLTSDLLAQLDNELPSVQRGRTIVERSMRTLKQGEGA